MAMTCRTSLWSTRTSMVVLLAVGLSSFACAQVTAQPDGETTADMPRYEQPDALAAEEALLSVQVDDDPATIYNAYSEFARTHFGAETDELIYETFGHELVFLDDGQWQHVSENSAALAWETNLPADSYVEYGPTEAYGHRTDATDRPYYLHLHHLTGLEAGQTYHYRIVATDERGNRLVSADQTLHTAPVEGVIRIPGDMAGPPYRLEQAGATYILTEDLTVPGGAIVIANDGITLDLNGHTINFANGDDHTHANGVRSEGRGDNPANIKVLNGRIEQGRSAMLDDNEDSLRFNPLSLRGRGIEVAGLAITYHAPQAWGALFHNNSGEVLIHHNVFKDMGALITNRHGTAVRTLGFRNGRGESPNQYKIHHNLVKRSRQNGISAAYNMFNNEVYIDSWSINSFAIQSMSSPGVDAGEHYNNRVFATGFNAFAFGWAHEDLKVHNNFVSMFGLETSHRWYEDWGDINILAGMRITNYGSGGQVRNNLEYWDNLILLRGRAGSHLQGTRFYSDESIKNTVFRDNVVKVEVLHDEPTDSAPIVAQGHFRKPDSLPIYYRNNRLISNLRTVQFGSPYGKGNNHYFEGNSFEKIGDHPDFSTFAFGGSWWNYGHVILDGDFGPGTSYDDVYWINVGSQSYYSVAWTLDLKAAPGATVTVVDADGEVEFTGEVDETGALAIPLTHCEIRPVEWEPADTGTEGRGVSAHREHQKVMKTPHTVTVTIDGEEISQSVEMTERRSVELR